MDGPYLCKEVPRLDLDPLHDLDHGRADAAADRQTGLSICQTQTQSQVGERLPSPSRTRPGIGLDGRKQSMNATQGLAVGLDSPNYSKHGPSGS
jgi:hypothetical protein